MWRRPGRHVLSRRCPAMSVSVAWCANGAIVWDAGADEVVQERHFDPSALAVAMHRLREVLPGAGVALLSARTMLLDETYLGLRYKRAYGAQVFSDIEAVLSRHRIAMVAVRHPRLAADHLWPLLQRPSLVSAWHLSPA